MNPPSHKHTEKHWMALIIEAGNSIPYTKHKDRKHEFPEQSVSENSRPNRFSNWNLNDV